MARVLVVENRKDVRRDLATILRTEGFEVKVARGGHEAVTKQQATPSAVVLMDMHMPHLDGIETATKIRDFDKIASFVAVSAYPRQYKRKAEQFPFSDWVGKPILTAKKKAKLLDAVRRGAGEAHSRALSICVPNLMGLLHGTETSSLAKAVRQLNESIRSRGSDMSVISPEASKIAQLSLLYDIGLLINESEVALELFSQVLFSELGGIEDIMEVFRDIGVAQIADAYERDMKRFVS